MLPLKNECYRSLLEFSCPQLLSALVWGGPWGSSRKPQGRIRRLSADKIAGKDFTEHTTMPGYSVHVLLRKRSLVSPPVSIP